MARSISRLLLALDLPASGTLTENFELVPDLLYSDTLVVTGTRNPQTKRESSVAITTISDLDDRNTLYLPIPFKAGGGRGAKSLKERNW